MGNWMIMKRGKKGSGMRRNPTFSTVREGEAEREREYMHSHKSSIYHNIQVNTIHTTLLFGNGLEELGNGLLTALLGLSRRLLHLTHPH